MAHPILIKGSCVHLLFKYLLAVSSTSQLNLLQRSSTHKRSRLILLWGKIRSLTLEMRILILLIVSILKHTGWGLKILN